MRRLYFAALPLLLSGFMFLAVRASLVTAATGEDSSALTSATAADRAAALTIVKTAPTTAAPGAPITYSLVVTNSGDTPATTLLITDVVPAGANYLSGGLFDGTSVSWSVASLAPGADVTVSFAVTATMTITNSDYTVAAAGGISATGSTSVRTDVLTPDLSIAKSGPTSTSAQQPVTYTLSVMNTGTYTATNLVITDTVPAGATYRSGGSFAGGTVSWAASELGPGGVVDVTFSVTATQSITNDDYVVSADFGFGAAGSVAVQTDFLAPALAIGKSGPATAVSGTPFSYALTVTNSGTLTATNLVVTDTLPTGATYLSGGSFDGTTISWAVPELGPGATASTAFTVTVGAAGVRSVSAAPSVVSTTITNSDYAVSADFGYDAVGQTPVVTIVSDPVYQLLLPFVSVVPLPGEPNNSCGEAFPLALNTSGQFYAEDMNDWYRFDLPDTRNVEVRLTNFAPEAGQIVLWFSPNGTCGDLAFVGSNGDLSATKIINAGSQPAGRYYLWLINDGSTTTNQLYTLRINAN